MPWNKDDDKDTKSADKSAATAVANVRPAHTIVKGGRYEDIDIVLIRENTEGLYVGIEHYIKIGSDPRAAAESIAIISRPSRVPRW